MVKVDVPLLSAEACKKHKLLLDQGLMKGSCIWDWGHCACIFDRQEKDRIRMLCGRVSHIHKMGLYPLLSSEQAHGNNSEKNLSRKFFCPIKLKDAYFVLNCTEC